MRRYSVVVPLGSSKLLAEVAADLISEKAGYECEIVEDQTSQDAVGYDPLQSLKAEVAK